MRITAVVGWSARVVQNDVEVAVVQPLDGGVAVRGLVDFVSSLGQPAREPAPKRVVVVGNQNTAHTPSIC
jgi:hypothetical protein